MRETVSNDIGAIADTELIKNRIILTQDSLLLRIHDDTHKFPRDWTNVSSEEVLKRQGDHELAKQAILNDGNNPLQLRMLEANYNHYLSARKRAMAEADTWTGQNRYDDTRIRNGGWS